MSLKICSLLLLNFSVLLFVGCSDSPTDGGGSEQKNKLEFNITTENTRSARPGGVVIFSSNVNRITADSLVGVRVTWETKNEGIRLEKQSPNTVAAFISKDFTGNKLTVKANIFKTSNSAITDENSKSKSIDIKDDLVSTEPLQGFITSDTTLDKEKIYRLVKDISLENSAVLTIKNGATLDLNGHAIISKNGILNLEGTKEKKVKLIVGKNTHERIEPTLKAQFIQILSSNNSAGIAVLGNSTIENSEIYGHFVVNICSISNSKINKLTNLEPGHSVDPYSMNISNSSIYQLYVNKTKEGVSLTAQNDVIFISNVNIPNTDFIKNNISYLSISGDNSDEKTIFKNNYISKLLIERKLSTSIQQNNIGLLKNRFYKKGEEPFWDPSWGEGFEKINGSIVTVNTSGPFQVREIDLSNNYWSPEILKEMNQKGSDKNISFIYDYYDDSNLDKVIYKNWSNTEF